MDSGVGTERGLIRTLTVDEGVLLAPSERGDRLLARVWPDLSRSRIQQLIKEQRITLNSKPFRASESVTAGDVLNAEIPGPVVPDALLPHRMELDVLFEDPHLLVINKPEGLVVHPGAGTGSDTLVHGLLHHCKDLSGIGGVERPGIVHRLDKETSGCLVVAKDDIAHQRLSAQFANREVEKIYLAVVDGRLRRPSGTVEAAIGRHRVHRQKMAVLEDGRGRPAITEWRCLLHEHGCSLLECRPRTGRTHQIRVHLKHLGHPILGDSVYGNRGSWTRHLLHAWKIAFRHPVSGLEICCTAPVPADFPLLPPAG
jgi:23S rRNA pseudouridine1911/1915/1917 synthase